MQRLIARVYVVVAAYIIAFYLVWGPHLYPVPVRCVVAGMLLLVTIFAQEKRVPGQGVRREPLSLFLLYANMLAMIFFFLQIGPLIRRS